MNKPAVSDVWKKYFIVLLALVIGFILAVVGHRTGVFDFFNTPQIAGYHIALNSGYAGRSKLPAIARKVLNGNAIIDLTNNARAANGLPPLDENRLLDSIAQSRARDMLEKQYFDHVAPTGEQVSDLAERVGYHYRIIAENIGSGDFISNQKIVDGWMQSPDHRENILSTDVREIGAAVLKGTMKDSDTYIAVQVFGLQSRPVAKKICVAPSDNLLHDIELKKAEIESLRGQLDRLKQELETERNAITTQRTHTEDDARKIHALNIRIATFNEKSRWHNRMAEEEQAKSIVAESMINEYNKMVQTYNDCCNDKH